MKSKNIFGIIFLTMILIIISSVVSAVDITDCGSYTQNNTVYNINLTAYNRITFASVNEFCAVAPYSNYACTSMTNRLICMNFKGNNITINCAKNLVKPALIPNTDNVFLFQNSNNVILENCNLSYAGTHSQSYTRGMNIVNTTNMLIRNTEIRHDGYAMLFGFDNNIIIQNNYVPDTDEYGASDIYADNVTNLKFYNNSFYGNVVGITLVKTPNALFQNNRNGQHVTFSYGDTVYGFISDSVLDYINSYGNIGWFPLLTSTGVTAEFNNQAFYNGTNGGYNAVSISSVTFNSSLQYWFNNTTPPVCVENWIQNNSECNGINYTIIYYDNNSCSTVVDLPLTNGTQISCESALPITAYSIKNVDTSSIIAVIIVLFLISLFVGIGFMFFKNTEFIEKNLTIIIVAVVVLMLIFLLVAMFY